MLKITVEIEGMVCRMCEAHINDLIRWNLKVKNVTSSHSKGKTEIFSLYPIDDNNLKKIIVKSGYTVPGIHTEPYMKKGFSLFRKRDN